MRHSNRFMTLVAAVWLTFLASLAMSAWGKDTKQIFVTSEKDNTLIVLQANPNGGKYAQIATHTICLRPRDVQRTLDQRQLLIACGDEHAIAIWDIAAQKVIGKINAGEDPEMLDMSPDGRVIYVSNEEDATLTAYDLVAKKKIFAIKVGGEPEGVKLSKSGKQAYVTSEVNGMVHVIDIASQKIIKNITVGKRPRRFLLVSNDELWVSNELSASVSIIRLTDATVVGTINFKPQGMRSEDVTPVGMVLSPDGHTAYVGLGHANHVARVDVSSHTVRDYALVGKRAWGVALSRSGDRLFVTNGLSDDLTILDVVTFKAVQSIPVGRAPHSVTIDD